MRKPFLFIAFLFILCKGRASTVVAVASGNWTNFSTWSPGLPLQGDSIIIPAGITVTYNINLHLYSGSLNVLGNLNCVSDTLIIDCGGYFCVQSGGIVTGGYISVADGFNLGLVEVMNVFIYTPCSSGFIPGNFTIGVHGCGPTSVENMEVGIKLDVFPNPVYDELRVRSYNYDGNAHQVKGNEISIYNVMGEKIYSSALSGPDLKVDCSSFPSGFYFFELANPKKPARVKFLKQ
jgi:hypothetical protein